MPSSSESKTNDDKARQITSFRLTLVRHGQTRFNDRRIVQGHADSPLTEIGLLQTRLLAHRLPPLHQYARIYSSDLGRAVQTAEVLIRTQTGTESTPPPPPLTIDGRLRERTLGPNVDGKPVASFVRLCAQAQCKPDDFTPPGGQSLHDLRRQVVDFVQNRLLHEATQLDAEAKCDNIQRNILVVSHGITIREMIRYFAAFAHESWRRDAALVSKAITESPPNTSVSEFIIHLAGQSKWIQTVECVRLSDLSHLPEELRNQALHYKVNVA